MTQSLGYSDESQVPPDELLAAESADCDEEWEGWEQMEQSEAGWPWSPSRPLREQWPWCGGTREEWELTQRTTQELPVVHDPSCDASTDRAFECTCPEDDDPPVDPATKFGELSRQVTVPVEWSADPDLDDAIRAVTPHDPTGSPADTTCPNCGVVAVTRLAHWHDGLGCWTCQRSGVS